MVAGATPTVDELAVFSDGDSAINKDIKIATKLLI